MKKLLSIILLATMMFYSIGFYVAYRYNLRAVKREMKAAAATGRFMRDQLVSIEIDLSSKASIQSVEIEDGKELRYKGEMYDVVAVRIKNSRLVFECIHDKNETLLIGDFCRMMESNDGSGHAKKQLHIIKYSFPFFTVSSVQSVVVHRPFSIAPFNALLLSPIPFRDLNIPSPPPWQA